jgi:hypothetical protein
MGVRSQYARCFCRSYCICGRSRVLKSVRRKPVKPILLLLGAAVQIVLLCCTSALAQGTKTLLVNRPLDNDPVRIMRATEGTTALESDGKHFPNRYGWEATFNAGDDWLKNLSFTIKNVSNQAITYVEVSCALFETSDWRKELAAHSTPENPILGQARNVVGWRPEHALYSARLGRSSAEDSTRRPAFSLAPGQEFTIPIQDPKTYSDLKSSIEAREPLSTVNACDADIGTIFFADGTKWGGHNYMRPTDQPGRYEIIPASEAPQINQEMTR